MLIAALVAVTSCKTSEANYREAYDKAMAGRDSVAGFESTIYGRYRRQMHSEVAVVGGDTVEVRVQAVMATPDGGGTGETLRTYGLVVGQFKQAFNARSLRERLAGAGYQRAVIVNTAEPYYFVLLDTYDALSEASAAAREITSDKDFPVAMKSPLPFILKAVPDKQSPASKKAGRAAPSD